jgi:hypothetical protein
MLAGGVGQLAAQGAQQVGELLVVRAAMWKRNEFGTMVRPSTPDGAMGVHLTHELAAELDRAEAERNRRENVPSTARSSRPSKSLIPIGPRR